MRPRVGELLEVGPRLEHAHRERERHEVEPAEEQRAAKVLEELDDCRALGVEEALVREGEASVGVGVRVEHGLCWERGRGRGGEREGGRKRRERGG